MRKNTLSILLIDGNRTTRELLRTRLTLPGSAVTTADDGVAAVRALRQAHFDLVLTETVMPGLDGYLVAQFAHNFSADTTVVALHPAPRGADAFDLVLERYFELGFFLDTVCYLAARQTSTSEVGALRQLR